MSIDFKPAVRFLKNIVDKRAEVAKNIRAFAKNKPVEATILTLEVGALAYLDPPVGAAAAVAFVWLANRGGKFKLIRDEEKRAKTSAFIQPAA